jgi:DNA primase
MRSFIVTCEKRLWCRSGRDALKFLRRRGLSDQTIRAARLGYDHQKDGVTIPWFDGKQLRMVNVRRLNGEPKYDAEAGSVRGILYPSAKLQAGDPILLVEGEFDALLANQEAGKIVQAVTTGSASDRPTAKTLAAVALCRPVLTAFDADAAGDRAAKLWRSILPHARRIRPPSGKDITDSHQAGINLERWLLAEVRTARRESSG